MTANLNELKNYTNMVGQIDLYAQLMEEILFYTCKDLGIKKKKLKTCRPTLMLVSIQKKQRENNIYYFSEDLIKKIVQFIKIRNYYAHQCFRDNLIINDETGEVIELGQGDVMNNLSYVREVFDEVYESYYKHKFSLKNYFIKEVNKDNEIYV